MTEGLRQEILQKVANKHADVVRTWRAPAASLLDAMGRLSALVAPSVAEASALLALQQEELERLRPPEVADEYVRLLLGDRGLWDAKRTLTGLQASSEELLSLFEILAAVAAAPGPDALLGRELLERLLLRLKLLRGVEVQLLPLAGLPEHEQELPPAIWRREKTLELLEELQGEGRQPLAQETATLLELQGAREVLQALT